MGVMQCKDCHVTDIMRIIVCQKSKRFILYKDFSYH